MIVKSLNEKSSNVEDGNSIHRRQTDCENMNDESTTTQNKIKKYIFVVEELCMKDCIEEPF